MVGLLSYARNQGCQNEGKEGECILASTRTRVLSKGIWLLPQVCKRAPVSFATELGVYASWYSQASRSSSSNIVASIINNIGILTKEKQIGPHFDLVHWTKSTNFAFTFGTDNRIHWERCPTSQCLEKDPGVHPQVSLSVAIHRTVVVLSWFLEF